MSTIAQVITKNSRTTKFDSLFRSRYQIPIGMMIAVVLPALVQGLFTDIWLNRAVQFNTVFGASVALVVGYISYRRLHVFPGIVSGGYIFTAFTITFGILTATLIMLRIDYTRMQLLSSYLLTLLTFTYIHLKYVVKKPLRLGVIPSGGVASLPHAPRVAWHRISDPTAAVPDLEGVVVDLNADHTHEWNARITNFALSGTPVYHYKEVIEQLTGRVEIEHLSENTLGALNPSDVYLEIKGLIDVIVAALALAILFPLMALVAIIIRLDSSGPALYRQKRTGFRARPFTAYKFRTMRVQDPRTTLSDLEARNSAMTSDNDSRITRVGAFFRRTRIDELPQLINIVRGEMSIIGPRPEAVVLTKWYEKEIPFYHYRHIIKPGLTGWAQINQGHVTHVDDIKKKLNLDFYYVKNFSFWLDVLITIKTVQTIITGSGAR